MSVRSGQSIVVEFTTASFSTGAATNADSLPTGTLVVSGVDNAATVTVTNVDTGRYKAAVTLPTLAIGDVVELSVAATVSTVAGKAIVWRDTKDILLDTSGDVTFNNTTIATATNLTNLPAIPNNWLTAAGIAASALNGKGDWLLASSAPSNFSALGIGATGHITTVDTTTNLTNAPTAGDFTATMKTSLNAATPASITGNVGGSVVGDVQGKVLGGGASAISGVGVNANVTQSAGTTIHNSDGTLASATASTVTFPTTDAAGNSIPDDARYAYTVLEIAVGTGLGQIVLLTGKNGVRTFNILSGTCPVQLDATSQYIVLGSWQSHVNDYATGEDPAALVLNATASSYNTAGTIGQKINSAGGASDPLTNAVPGSYAAGTAGFVLGTNLDAKISTRSAPGTAQTIDQTTALPGTPTAGTIGEALKFADTRLDAAISTRSAPGTAQTIDQTTALPGTPGAGTIGEALKRADTNLDAAVSTRLATSGYTTPPTTGQIAAAVMTDVTDTVGADVVAIKAKTDNLPASPAAVGSQMDLVNAPNAIAVTAIQNGLSKPGTAQTVDTSTIIPSTGNVANSIADCLNAARVQGLGVWKIVGTTLNLYAPDGVTVVKAFTLDSATAPTQRT